MEMRKCRRPNWRVESAMRTHRLGGSYALLPEEDALWSHVTAAMTNQGMTSSSIYLLLS